ncbi:hypothetical protein AB0G04_11430 [Actinoplanes sp. NPDC023801]|uniref:hypothetical protein n=1 Tax=Actinoplanes sp. NPDC023801 TaxID=3154595 RepID=UPI0033C676FA
MPALPTLRRAAVTGLAVLVLTSGCGLFGGHDDRAAELMNGAVHDDETGVRLPRAVVDGIAVKFAPKDDPPPVVPKILTGVPNVPFQQKLADKAVILLKTMSDDVTGKIRPEDVADCSAGQLAKGWAASVRKGHAKELDVCVAAKDGAQWLRVTNRNGYPIVLMPARGATDATPTDYDVRMLQDDLFLLFGLQLEAVAGHRLAGGLKSAELEITTDNSFLVNVTASPLPIAWDVGTALLSIVLPGVPRAKALLSSAERATIKAMGGPAASMRASKETVVNQIKNDPTLRDMGEQAEQVQALVDLWSCLVKSKAAVMDVSVKDGYEAIRYCVGLVAQPFGKEVVALGADLLKNLKVFNEVRDFLRHAITPAVIEVRAPLRESRLGNVDWLATAGSNLGCDSEPEMLQRLVQHDITGDGVPDTFVTLDCYTSNQIAPDEIQVYDGSSDPAAPALLGVLTDGVSANFHLKCLTFEGKTVLTRGYVLKGDDPAGVPSLLGVRSATWDGTVFRLSSLSTSAAPDGYDSDVPGCD